VLPSQTLFSSKHLMIILIQQTRHLPVTEEAELYKANLIWGFFDSSRFSDHNPAGVLLCRLYEKIL